ncbi:unnamed protein product [Lota lota]
MELVALSQKTLYCSALRCSQRGTVNLATKQSCQRHHTLANQAGPGFCCSRASPSPRQPDTGPPSRDPGPPNDGGGRD